MQQPPFPTPSEQPGAYPPPPAPSEQIGPYSSPPSQPGGYPSAPPQPDYAAYPGQPGVPPSGYAYPGYPPQAVRPSSPASTALKYGLIFGAALVVAYLISIGVNRLLVNVLISSRTSISAISIFSLIPAAIFTLIYWVIYFFAGFLTGRKAQNVGMAALAGVWAALCFFVVYCVVLLINVISVLSIVARYGGMGGYLIGLATSIAGVIILQIGGGIGFSALGGLVGKGQGRRS